MKTKVISQDTTVSLRLTLKQAHLLYGLCRPFIRSKSFASSHSCFYSDLLSVFHDLACLDVSYFKSTDLLPF